MSMRPLQPRRGFAVLTVAFMLMVGSLALMGMLSHQRTEVERTATLLAQAQGTGYVLGAETLARQVLAADAASSPGIDYLGQHWARLTNGLSVENGTLAFSLADLQGRFNLNTLFFNDAAQERFRRLLRILQLRDGVAETIIAAFGTRDAPHFFNDIADLRSIPDLGIDEFAALLPVATVLPEKESMLNVNTASDPVLRAYIPDEKICRKLLELRLKNGFVTGAQLNGIGTNTKGMGVASDYFMFRAKAVLNGRSITLVSVIDRQHMITGTTIFHIVSRDLSGAL